MLPMYVELHLKLLKLNTSANAHFRYLFIMRFSTNWLQFIYTPELNVQYGMKNVSMPIRSYFGLMNKITIELSNMIICTIIIAWEQNLRANLDVIEQLFYPSDQF